MSQDQAVAAAINMDKEGRLTKDGGATATALTFTGHVTSEDWVLISAIYIGGQTVIDGIARLRGHNA